MGGTGKTPTIELLISLLQSNYKVAVLSRGYGRQSKGFVLADALSSVKSIGDEPFQIAHKFPKITVAVDANRQRGIETLLALNNPPEVVLLDDAFQHRKVSPGLSILLTAYDDLYCDDVVLPSGGLREQRSGAQRAQIIVVTKCPVDVTEQEKENILLKSINELNEKYKKVITLRLENYKNNQIAQKTGLSEANVRVIINRAKNQLTNKINSLSK